MHPGGVPDGPNSRPWCAAVLGRSNVTRSKRITQFPFDSPSRASNPRRHWRPVRCPNPGGIPENSPIASALGTWIDRPPFVPKERLNRHHILRRFLIRSRPRRRTKVGRCSRDVCVRGPSLSLASLTAATPQRPAPNARPAVRCPHKDAPYSNHLMLEHFPQAVLLSRRQT